jgi:hypothetical protein
MTHIIFGRCTNVSRERTRKYTSDPVDFFLDAHSGEDTLLEK